MKEQFVVMEWVRFQELVATASAALAVLSDPDDLGLVHDRLVVADELISAVRELTFDGARLVSVGAEKGPS